VKNMQLLAIDTSAAACSVALVINDDIKLVHEIIPMQQAQCILPMIDELLKSNGVKVTDLSALAFGCGPGSFTGVRIATSVIQGLAFATQLPIIRVSSLAAAAQTAYEEFHWQKIFVAMDARMNEIYCGAYQVNATGLMELHGAELLCRPENFPLKEDNEWYGAGNGWKVYQELLRCKPVAVAEEILASALGVSLLAKAKFLRHEWLTADQAIPVYLRDDVAEKGR
jgi:tRNA threonylcarbamoyladenosine biosynthesis protein TsaB